MLHQCSCEWANLGHIAGSRSGRVSEMPERAYVHASLTTILSKHTQRKAILAKRSQPVRPAWLTGRPECPVGLHRHRLD